MADLSGLAAFGSAIYPGVVQGQTNQAVSQQQQEAAKQAQMRTQEIASDVASDVSYANSLAALSTVFNTPPGNPPPQGAGQASQPSAAAAAAAAPQPPPQGAPPQGAAPGVVPPTPPGQTQPMPATSTGQPVAPPGGTFGASAPGGPVAGPPPQAQPQRPPMLPQAAPRPQGASPGGPPPQGAQQPNPQQIVALAKQKAAQAEQQTAQATAPAQGQMSMQQLVALVNKANPGLAQKNPSAFVKTVERLQKFLSEDGKQELAQQKVQLSTQALQDKLTQFQQTLLFKQQSEQDKVVATQQADALRAQIAQLTDARARDAMDERLTGIMAQIVGRRGLAEDKELLSLKTAAAKLGVAPSDDDTPASLQLKIAKQATAKDTMPPETADFYASALRSGNMPLVNSVLGMSRNRAALMGQIVAAAQKQDPNFTGGKATGAMVQLGFNKAEASSIAKIAGPSAVGTNEAGAIVPQAVAAAKALGQTNYPTVNAVRNAIKARAGTPEEQAQLATLNQFITAMQSAYRLVIQRGGTGAVHYQEQAEKLINGNLSIPALVADGQAIQKEGVIVGQATKRALSDVTGGGNAPAPAETGGDTGGDVDTSNPLLK